MKIEIEINRETYCWKSDYEDHSIYDIAEKFKGLLVSAGFHPDNVDGIFDECVIGSWQLPSDKNLYADELEEEYDKHDKETNVSIESLK
jgi:Tat protein secretion system quality control protein TatD with DNase activity